MSEQNPTHNGRNFQDLTGQVFGRLCAIKRDPRPRGEKVFWVCKCECGKECTIQAWYLTSGRRTHCGCQKGNRWKEAMRRFHQQHPQPTAIAIELSDGLAVIIDEEDYPEVSAFWWSPHRGTRTTYARAGSGAERILLHVLLMGEMDGQTIDHVNGNGLDNRRCNLRWATRSEQSRNIHVGRGRSLFKGVSWSPRHRKWVVAISIEGSNLHIGYFDNEEEAALAYDTAAKKAYGEFACLNFGGGPSHVGG